MQFVAVLTGDATLLIVIAKRQLSFGVILAEVSGRVSDPPFERPCERTLFGETGKEGDLRQRISRVAQQAFCQFSPGCDRQGLEA